MTRRSLITGALIEEATTVTSHGDGHQFEIQLGHLCNNRCLFCSSGHLSELKIARTVARDPVIEAILHARAQGARRVTFLGGEPTIQKSFLPALEAAVGCGFEEVVIFTNGVMFPVEGFIERVVAMGRFEWRVSIQGGNEAAHVAVTQRPDSFRRIAHGLERLQALGQRVTANLCVNEASYRSLPDYPSLVARYGIRQLHVDVVRPASVGDRGEAHLRAIMPRYTDMAPWFDAMLSRFERDAPGFDVNVGNLPYCVLPAWAHHIHHGGEQTVTQSCDVEGLEVAVDKYGWHSSLRRHVAACEGCVFRAECSGVFGEYLALYGDEEFRAVSYDQLVALDPRRRGFVRLASPALGELFARLASPAGVAGWVSSGGVDDSRRRVIERVLASPSGRVALRFEPPEGLGAEGDPAAEVLRTGLFRLALRVDEAADEESLRALLEALREALSGPRVLGVARPLDVDAVVSRHRLVLRARALVRRMVERVARGFARGAWSVVSVDETAHGMGRAVTLGDRAGRRVNVSLTVSVRGDRLAPAVEFSLGDGADASVARAVADRVVALLAPPGQGVGLV